MPANNVFMTFMLEPCNETLIKTFLSTTFPSGFEELIFIFFAFWRFLQLTCLLVCIMASLEQLFKGRMITIFSRHSTHFIYTLDFFEISQISLEALPPYIV